MDRVAWSKRCAIECAATTENDGLNSKAGKRKCRYVQTAKFNSLTLKVRDRRSAKRRLWPATPGRPEQWATKPAHAPSHFASRLRIDGSSSPRFAVAFGKAILSLDGIARAARTKFLRDLGCSQVEGFALVRHCLTPMSPRSCCARGILRRTWPGSLARRVQGCRSFSLFCAPG